MNILGENFSFYDLSCMALALVIFGTALVGIGAGLIYLLGDL